MKKRLEKQICLTLVVLAILALGLLITLFCYQNLFWQSESMELSSAEGETLAPTDEQREVTGSVVLSIPVYISGAVRNPAVYYLPSQALLCDLIRAAGGLLPEADARHINLAMTLQANQHIDLPFLGEVPHESGQDDALKSSELGSEGQHLSGEQEGKFNLNLIDVPTLCQIPGIGQSTAAAIIRYREQHGPFKSLEDLKQVSGIKEKRFEQIRDYFYLAP